MRHCFLKTKACEDRRKKEVSKRVYGPPPPMKSLPYNTLTCSNPQSSIFKGQTVRSRESEGPIELTHPSNKKLLDKMEKESEKLKKELLAIDAMMENKNYSDSMESGE